MGYVVWSPSFMDYGKSGLGRWGILAPNLMLKSVPPYRQNHYFELPSGFLASTLEYDEVRT